MATHLRRIASFLLVSLLFVLATTEGLRADPSGGGGGPKRGTIVGEVVGPSGPVGGATVMLFDGVAIDQVAETITDANGNFEFRRVAEGDYTLTAISLSPPCAGSASVAVVARQTSVVVIACQ